MKYLIACFIVGLFGCTEEKAPGFVPVDKGETNRECEYMVDIGWIKEQKDFDRCNKHMNKPKFKSGQFLKMKDSGRVPNCRFRVNFADWSGPRHDAMYEGTILCKDINGKYETVDNLAMKLETDLKAVK